MKFNDFFWPDSDLEQVLIYYNVAELTIWNSALGRRVIVRCEGLAGITDLCIWDDQIILDVDFRYISGADVFTSQDTFLQKLCKAYPYDSPWDEKKLEDGIVLLRFLLTNHVWFSIYCQSVDVAMHKNQDKAMF
ncbi:MAG: hypothetical protein MR473_02305 [Clostridiales bacterium]|nr:hypothetical protein [Clostridiales bacterium]